MILFAESNFVLELAFRRDDFESCEALLELAQEKRIDLVLPAFCLTEPYEALTRRRRARGKAHEDVNRELNELKRCRHYAEAADELANLSELLIESSEEEQIQLGQVQAMLLKSASIIPLGPEILSQLMKVQRKTDLSPQDSVVYASVLSRLAQDRTPKCFVTTNSGDFSTATINSELQSHDCKLLFRFEHALQYIGHKITRI